MVVFLYKIVQVQSIYQIYNLKMNQQQPKNQVQIPVSLIKFQPPIHISNLNVYQQSKNIIKNQKQHPTIEDILSIIIPPRQTYSKTGQLFVQYVNHDKLRREDVDILKQKFDQLLIFQKAKTQGICHIKQKLFSQALDQIIRQVVIDCPQRGIMLMRVRDQQKMTLTVYETLYKQSLTFSKIKMGQNQSSLLQLQKEYQQLKTKNSNLLKKKAYLQSKKSSLQLRQRQFKTVLKDKREHQLESLQVQQNQLSRFLQKIRITNKKKISLQRAQNEVQQNEATLIIKA